MTPSASPLRSAVRAIRPLLLGAAAAAALGCAAKGQGAAPAAPPAAAAAPTVVPVDPDLAPRGSIVIPRATRGGDAGTSSRHKAGDEDAEFFREKFDLAYAASGEGDDETALALVASALALDPPEPWASKLKALRQSVQARHLELDVVRVDARGARDYVVFDEDVDFVVRIRNLGGHDLVVKPPAGPGPAEVSGSVLALSIHRRDRDIYSAELVRSWTQVVPLVVAGQPDLVVPPESSHEVRVRVPAEDAGGAISGLRVLEVGGDLRLTGASLGIIQPVRKMPIRAGRVVALPRNYEPIAADPLGSLRKALNAAAPVHVLIAVEFLPAADRAAAVQALADALAAGEEALAPTIASALAMLRERAGETAAQALAEPLIRRMRTHPSRTPDLADALVALTAVALAPDARLWEDWWRRRAR